MNRHALLLALPLLLVGCPEKEVDDLIEEEEDEDDGGGGVVAGDCPEEDLGGSIGQAVAEGQITRESTRYRYCGGSGGSDSGGSDGWGSGSGSSTGGGWDTAPGAPPPDGPDGGGSPGISFLWTAPSSGSFVFDTCGSTYDTTLGVRAPDCDGDTLECNDDWYGLKSRVQVSADAGETYVVVVSGFSGDTGRYTLNIGQGDAAGDCAGDTGWGTTSTGWYGTTGTTGSVTTGWEPPTASVEWGASGLTLEIGAGGGEYWFGLAQTTGEDPWTGEDCVYGYESSDGSTLSYCHYAGDSGTFLTYGGDRYALATGTTAFEDASLDGQITYVLASEWSGRCYVWGDDTSYYDGLGCDAL
jgi:hypothetical protein